MMNLDELKKTIAATWRDDEMASSACYGIDAYAKLWPYVFMVNDWRVWNESGRDLNLEVIRWLDDQGSDWDFYHLLDEWGLVGFSDLQTATRFRHRWFGTLKVVSSSDTPWNPHPLSSTFAPRVADEALTPARKDRHAVQ
ncbi:MAG TPA: hypothetical protein VGU19_07660 [Microvirga sp.]|jgi:hypothetical protein|nr:hypothetical protein [Microvirga sp.]